MQVKLKRIRGGAGKSGDSRSQVLGTIFFTNGYAVVDVPKAKLADFNEELDAAEVPFARCPMDEGPGTQKVVEKLTASDAAPGSKKNDGDKTPPENFIPYAEAQKMGLSVQELSALPKMIDSTGKKPVPMIDRKALEEAIAAKQAAKEAAEADKNKTPGE